jgi:hypothetical protein
MIIFIIEITILLVIRNNKIILLMISSISHNKTKITMTNKTRDKS